MRHRIQWFFHLGAQGISKGDEHPTNTSHGVGGTRCLIAIHWGSRPAGRVPEQTPLTEDQSSFTVVQH